MDRRRRAAVALAATLAAAGGALGCNRRPQAVLEYEQPVTITTTGTPSTAPPEAAPPPPAGPSRGGWRHAKDKD